MFALTPLTYWSTLTYFSTFNPHIKSVFDLLYYYILVALYDYRELDNLFPFTWAFPKISLLSSIQIVVSCANTRYSQL